MKYFIIRYREDGSYIESVDLTRNEPPIILKGYTWTDARIFTENQAQSIQYFIDNLNIELIEVTDKVKTKLSL